MHDTFSKYLASSHLWFRFPELEGVSTYSVTLKGLPFLLSFPASYIYSEPDWITFHVKKNHYNSEVTDVISEDIFKENILRSSYSFLWNQTLYIEEKKQHKLFASLGLSAFPIALLKALFAPMIFFSNL